MAFLVFPTLGGIKASPLNIIAAFDSEDAMEAFLAERASGPGRLEVLDTERLAVRFWDTNTGKPAWEPVKVNPDLL